MILADTETLGGFNVVEIKEFLKDYKLEDFKEEIFYCLVTFIVIIVGYRLVIELCKIGLELVK